MSSTTSPSSTPSPTLPPMTSVERIVAAVGLQPVDRTPVVPVLLQQGAKELEISLKEYFGTPARLAEGQQRLLDRYDHDAVFAMPHIVQDTLPWGSELIYHEQGAPSVSRMVIDRYEQIARLRTPLASAHPYLRYTLAAAEKLASKYKGNRLLIGAVIGPFSLPSLLMGTDKFLNLLLKHADDREQYFRPLMERMLEYTTTWANAQFAAGCDLVVVAEGIASATILRENTFRKYALPVLQEFHQRAKGMIGLEMVGDAVPFTSYLKDLPCVALLIGSTDPVTAMRQKLGRQKALIGNVNNIKLLRWGAERIEFEARRLIAEAGPGFILANQGPEIPWEVPPESIHALVRAARASVPPATSS